MTETIHVTYLFDPLCGWCYGASPAIEALTAQPDVTVALAPAGLFAGDGARPMDAGFADYAWSNDQRISRLTGQTFSEAYRTRVLADRSRPFDSGPATLALTAVAESAAAREFEALKAIQRARYVEGRDTTDRAVLGDVLESLGLAAAAERVRAADPALIAAFRQRVKAARTAMQRFGIQGVPALLVGRGEERRRVRTNALFTGIDSLLADLKAA